jgi:hypothetical protein
LLTLEELFGVNAPGGGFLGDANTPGTNDLSDLFRPGAITGVVPETDTWAMMLIGFAALGGVAFFGRRGATRVPAGLG